MARRFTMGFEEAGTTAWANMGLSTALTVSTGRNTMVDNSVQAPHSGTYCYRSDTSGSPTNGTASITKSTGINKTSGTAWVGGYFLWHSPRTQVTSAICEIQSSTVVTVYRIALQGTTAGDNLAKLILTNVVASTTTTSTTVLSPDLWYRLELGMTISATLGTLELRIFLGDSTTALEILTLNGGQNTLNGNVQRMRIGQPTASNVQWTYYFDDWRWNDDVDPGDGSSMTWVGPGKIALMTPNADTLVTWTKAGSAPASTNWDGVNDVPGDVDDGVTFNTDSGTTNVDKLGLTPLPAEVTVDALIKVADVFARVQAEAASQTMILRLWDESGGFQDSTSIALGNAVWGSSGSGTLVKNCVGKTKGNLNSFSVGYKGNSGAAAKDVTAIMMNVEWLESTAQILMGAMLL